MEEIKFIKEEIYQNFKKETGKINNLFSITEYLALLEKIEKT